MAHTCMSEKLRLEWDGVGQDLASMASEMGAGVQTPNICGKEVNWNKTINTMFKVAHIQYIIQVLSLVYKIKN